MSEAELRAAAAEAQRWLFDEAFPLWSTAGFDAGAGQFVEALATADGAPLADLPRRVIVQARQLYVFATAGRMGWSGPWRAVAGAAADALLARGRDAEGDWIFAFGPDGRPLDTRRDLYTQAFAIFGLVHAGAALGRGELIEAARATRARLESAWRAPSGGFVEGALHPGLRRQNPHMHLFEAAMALLETDGREADRALAQELWDLFVRRFVQPSGVVLEYFDADLVPLPDERGRVWEPGHAFEWSWLADRWGAAGGASWADRLYAAGRTGVSAAEIAIDEVWIDGGIKTASARLWPQTEWLKAALARRARGDTEGAAEAVAAWRALSTYLSGVAPGAWRDRRLTDGGWADGPAPASSGYHVVCALEALIRAAG